MVSWNNLDSLNSYKKMLSIAGTNEDRVKLSKELNKKRIEDFQCKMAGGLTYNYAAKQVNSAILEVLQKLSEEQQLIEKYKLLLNGEVVNTGENRKVLHQLVRGQLGDDVIYNGKNLGNFYKEQLKAIEDFAQKIHSKEICGTNNQAFTNVVQIGIGGSDLGPRALYLALDQWAINNKTKKMDAHFISNVDPDDATAVLSKLKLNQTLFILVSKSGTTQETLANELFVKSALEKANCDPSKHIVAVTSETSPLANNPNYLASFYIDDFIGGRYSATSAVGGVVLSLAFGIDSFKSLLNGANEADKTALNKNILENPSLLDALIGVFERNALNYPSTAILPYSQALSRFPAHLQQADMESNGKQVNRDGKPVNYKTGPVIFGEPGTNGQHSFYQLLHQGTDIIPLQFIGFTESQAKNDINVENSTSQEKLLANLIAQIVSFARGKASDNPNQNFPGERPSSLIYGKELNPKSLGSLLAHFENKIMFQGFVWNLNSFDQEGVQLGKVLTNQILNDEMDEVLKTYSKLLV